MNTDHEIGALGARMGAVEEDIKEIRHDVREMLEFMQQARGSWKTVMGIAGLLPPSVRLWRKSFPSFPYGD